MDNNTLWSILTIQSDVRFCGVFHQAHIFLKDSALLFLGKWIRAGKKNVDRLQN